MSHFIVKDEDGDYLYHRRNIGHQYVDRSMWGPSLGEARVFTTKSAATNSANQSNTDCEFLVIEVELKVKDD